MPANELDIDKVIERLKGKEGERGRVSPDLLPKGYDLEQAIMAAWSKLRVAKVKINREEYPLLSNVTAESVCDALANMVILGLTPSKDQCYFIPRGKAPNMKLNMQASKFGTKAILIRHTDIRDATSHAVFSDDEFEYEGDGITWKVTKHRQNLVSREPNEGDSCGSAESIRRRIVGAYATIIWKDGYRVTGVMSRREIMGAWAMGQPNNYKGDPDKAEQNLTPFQKSRPISATERSALVHVAKPYVNSLPTIPSAGLNDREAQVESEDQDLNQKAQDAASGEPVGPPEVGNGNGPNGDGTPTEPQGNAQKSNPSGGQNQQQQPQQQQPAQNERGPGF